MSSGRIWTEEAASYYNLDIDYYFQLFTSFTTFQWLHFSPYSIHIVSSSPFFPLCLLVATPETYTLQHSLGNTLHELSKK